MEWLVWAGVGSAVVAAAARLTIPWIWPDSTAATVVQLVLGGAGDGDGDGGGGGCGGGGGGD